MSFRRKMGFFGLIEKCMLREMHCCEEKDEAGEVTVYTLWGRKRRSGVRVAGKTIGNFVASTIGALSICTEQSAAVPPAFWALLHLVIDHCECRLAELEAGLRSVKKATENLAPWMKPCRRARTIRMETLTVWRGSQPVKHGRARLLPSRMCVDYHVFLAARREPRPPKILFSTS
ncbi:MAG: hypothetical protein NTZ32_19330 [Planctomycetales bacterium]|nr:hypothetical protein [Planctomycetales bacterium]